MRCDLFDEKLVHSARVRYDLRRLHRPHRIGSCKKPIEIRPNDQMFGLESPREGGFILIEAHLSLRRT